MMWLAVALLSLAILSASAARAEPIDRSVMIDFERFPGPDVILGTADDTFPACDAHGVCEGLGGTDIA
jgi:hypothetical protein